MEEAEKRWISSHCITVILTTSWHHLSSRTVTLNQKKYLFLNYCGRVEGGRRICFFTSFHPRSGFYRPFCLPTICCQLDDLSLRKMKNSSTLDHLCKVLSRTETSLKSLNILNRVNSTFSNLMLTNWGCLIYRTSVSRTYFGFVSYGFCERP